MVAARSRLTREIAARSRPTRAETGTGDRLGKNQPITKVLAWEEFPICDVGTAYVFASCQPVVLAGLL
jgi:hypothetical protein